MALSLTLFENETKRFDWTDRDLRSLEHMNHSVGLEALRATVLKGKHALQATNHVGIFRFGNTTVQVLPKFYRSRSAQTSPQDEQEAMSNLLYLLSYALQLPIREYSIAPLAQQSQDWFELLISLFTAHLTEEWHRGAFRSYQGIDNELPMLKGRWRVGEHLRHPERRHLFAVTYDEFSVDVPLNQVFRFVVERLWHITRNNHTRQQLGNLRQWMEDVTLLSTLSIDDTTTIAITRLNQRFAPLLELARLFIEKSTFQLSRGDVPTFAFIVDMNRLFESFLINFIRHHRNEILPSPLQGCELLSQSKGVTYHLATLSDTGKAVFRLKPDLAFYSPTSNRFLFLLDAKYKRLAYTDITAGISQDDFYQMYAYAHRYSCPRVLLLYPQTAEMPEALCRRFALTGHDHFISAATVDLRVDLARKEEQQGLINRIQNIIVSEFSI
jgi:5-methylcytosine-specific restriction enzyme subunit McrC